MVEGANQSFTITPSANYQVADVLVDSVSVGAATSYTFTNLTAAHTIAASFTIKEYALTLNAANGSISANPTPNGSGGKYTSGTVITLTPTANAGYSFSGWGGACSGLASCLVTMDADKSVTAAFTQNEYTLIYVAGANGTISGTTPQTVEQGASGTAVTAVANTGYHFILWSDSNTNATRTDSNVLANATYTATFAANNYTVTYNGNGNTGGTAPAAQNGDYNTSISVAGNTGGLVKTGYIFAGWNTAADGSGTAYAADSSYTIPAQNTILYAQWTVTTLTITSSATNGTITPTGATNVNYGGSQSYSFTPNAGYNLSTLKIDGSPVILPNGNYTFTNVTANHTIEAIFSSCIGVSTPTLTSQRGVTAAIPVNTNDVAGANIIAAQFTFTYDQTVFSPAPADISVTPGTVLPSGVNAPQIDVNKSTPGTIYVSIYGSTAFSGSGSLVNINLKVIGAVNSSSALTLTDFLYNGGYVCTEMTSGTLTVTSTQTTTTVSSSANFSVFGNAVTFTATVSPIPAGGTVDFVIDGSTVASGVSLNGSGQAAYTISTLTVAGSPHSVTANYSGSAPQYLASSGSLSPGQTVNAANQTITVTTAAPASAAYGSTFNVAATASSSLPLSITTSGSCSGSGSGSTTITMTSGTGVCMVHYNQAGNGNYNAATEVINTTNATKALATWTTNPATKIYGDLDPSPLTIGSGSGFLAADNVTATYSRVAGENVGTYHIAATLSATGNLNNYTITNVGTNYTITKRAATWTTNNAGKVYGDADPNPLTTGSGNGFLSSDGVSVVYTRAAGESVAGAPYHITATLSATGDLNNYDITNAGADFTITPRPATWTTNGASKIYGNADPNPLTTGSGSGFLIGDGVTATYSRAAGENAATYHITAILSATGDLSNYTIINNGATFTITGRTLTGAVTYKNAANPVVPVANTAITASGAAPVPSPVLNDLSGNYSMTGFGTGSYTISATKSAYTCSNTRGIFGDDASLISRYAIHSATLNDNQIEAGKVSGLANLTSFDAALIAQYIVCIDNPVNQTGRWKFFDASTTVGASSVLNFEGILKGDVNGSWSADTSIPVFNPVVEEEQTAVRVSAADVSATQNTAINVPVRLDNLGGQNVDSYQFDIEYDPAVVTPETAAVSISGTNSATLSVVSNVPRSGLIKAVVYGSLPVNGDGVYANLKFTTTGSAGARTDIGIRSFRFNDGQNGVTIKNGSVIVSAANGTAVIRGRLLTAFGKSVKGARVFVTATNGTNYNVLSSYFGYFEFSGLTAGETYTVTVRSKQYKFTLRTVSLTENLTEFEMIAEQ